MLYKKIGVFLSAKENLPEEYVSAAREVGALIGGTGRTLVYGGSRSGLMEVLAQGVRRGGGRVFGMVPEVVARRGLASDAIDVVFRCADLSDRKAAMERESDLLVALPGGIGTLDEVFTVLANASIGIRRKPVVFYNAAGCWDTLLAALDDLFAKGLISGRPADFYRTASGVEDLRAILDNG